MDVRLEELLSIYIVKVQSHDRTTMDYIKLAIMARYQLDEEQFKATYNDFATKYVKGETSKIYGKILPKM